MGFDWLGREIHPVGDGNTVPEIIDRVEAERRAAQHAAPEQMFTIEQAHREMQRHKDCSAIDCPRKQAARDVLIRARRMVPADDRQGIRR
ncbi:hypothetical protein [Nocardia fluminea]|uniref:hypothetical protein n=1 Tax=Nocardia fluminea TaxID=134984 RepID=UPI00379C5DC2